MNQRKILVFAHVPPPHHGQSVMVKVLLEGLRADPRFEVHHVDARVSDDLEDIGSFHPKKFLRLFKCISQAWWIRLRHGRMAFYYVPAPAKRSAILRDWFVMALCRPLFPEVILHWHAYGLGEWVAAGSDWQRQLTRWALGKADLSIVLNNYNKRDAEVFAPQRIEVVPNGIADQFPDYDERLAPKREARAEQLRKLAAPTSEAGMSLTEHRSARALGVDGRLATAGETSRSEGVNKGNEANEAGRGEGGGEAAHDVILQNVHVAAGDEGGEVETGRVGRSESGNRAERDRLERSDSRGAGSPAGEINVGELEAVRLLFLGHLIETKGVFVAIEATRMANAELGMRNAPWRAHLTLAGSFASEEEKVRVLVAVEKANQVARWEDSHGGAEAPRFPREEPMIELAGFLDTGQKKSALERADCLVFPTFYETEAQPLVLLEAMSAGLPVITTSWRGVAEVLPWGYPAPAAPKSAAECADRMLRIGDHCRSDNLRRQFAEHFTLQKHLAALLDRLR